jgi:hypothetical protein
MVFVFRLSADTSWLLANIWCILAFKEKHLYGRSGNNHYEIIQET